MLIVLLVSVPPSLSFPDLVECNHAVRLLEGSDLKVDFVVTSDPALDSGSRNVLSKQGGTPDEAHVYIQGSAVHLKAVRRSDAGTYTVSSCNAAGRGQASFQVKIKCKHYAQTS